MEGITMASDPSSSTSTSSSISTSASASATSKGKTAEKKKRRTEVKRIEEKGNLFVTYSKRRKGLYSKAHQLCEIAPRAQAAVITFSPSGKVCAYGNPSVDAVVNRYLRGQNDANPSPSLPTEAASEAQPREEKEGEFTVNGDPVVDQYLLSRNNANPSLSSSPSPEANNGVVAVRAPKSSKDGEGEEEEEEEEEKDEELRFYREEIERLWRDDSAEDVSLEELKDYREGLEGLWYKVYMKLEEIRRRDCTRIFF